MARFFVALWWPDQRGSTVHIVRVLSTIAVVLDSVVSKANSTFYGKIVLRKKLKLKE